MSRIQRRLSERIDTTPHGLSFEDAQRVLRKMLWLENTRPTWNFCTDGYPQTRLVHEAAQRALLVSNFAETFTRPTREGDLEHLRLTESGRNLAQFLGALPLSRREFYAML
jgi:hypothetical protein